MTLRTLTRLNARLDGALTEFWTRDIENRDYSGGARKDRILLKDGTRVTVSRNEPKAPSRYYKVEDPGGALMKYEQRRGKNKNRLSADWLTHPEQAKGKMPTRKQVESIKRVSGRVLRRADKLKAPVYADPVPFGRMSREALVRMYGKSGIHPVRPRTPADVGVRWGSLKRSQRWNMPGQLVRKPKLR